MLLNSNEERDAALLEGVTVPLLLIGLETAAALVAARSAGVAGWQPDRFGPHMHEPPFKH